MIVHIRLEELRHWGPTKRSPVNHTIVVLIYFVKEWLIIFCNINRKWNKRVNEQGLKDLSFYFSPTPSTWLGKINSTGIHGN